MANPYEEALDLYSLDEFQAILEQYLGMYAEGGKTAYSTLEEQYQMLINNPMYLSEMFGESYTASPGYEYQMEEAMNAANQAAAAGGMLGTQSHQTTAMTQASNIANQDYWQYMNYMTDLYNMGLKVASDLNQMGYSANAAMVDEVTRFIGAQMGLTTQAGIYSNQQNSNIISGITSGLMGMAGGMF